MTIKSTDKYFYTDGCGSWTRLMPKGPQKTSFGDGTHAVGIHIKPGTYYTGGSNETCYWEVAQDFSGEFNSIIDNAFIESPGSMWVYFYAGESFCSSGCGTWMRVG